MGFAKEIRTDEKGIDASGSLLCDIAWDNRNLQRQVEGGSDREWEITLWGRAKLRGQRFVKLSWVEEQVQSEEGMGLGTSQQG